MIKRKRLENLIKEAQKRLAKINKTYPLSIPKGPNKGFDIICLHCGTKNQLAMEEVYAPENIGASEHLPDQTWLQLYCKKCGNHKSIWTDWYPNEVTPN